VFTLLLRSLSLESFAWIRARRTLLQATRWQQAAEQWHLALAKMTKVLCKVVFGVNLDDLRDLPGMAAPRWCRAVVPRVLTRRLPTPSLPFPPVARQRAA